MYHPPDGSSKSEYIELYNRGNKTVDVSEWLLTGGIKFKFNKNDTILFGRESEGVPKIVHKNSYQRLKIPLKKNARSLNIGMAVAITLSEALRQNIK